MGLSKQVGKYFEYLCRSDIVTLPHIGGLEVLLATQPAAMTLEVILCQCFGKCISDLVLSAHRENLDEPLLHMFTKVMIAYVYVLGSRT